MECPSCGFQNLPHLEQCARCTGRLDFAGVRIEPYRASDRGAWLRRLLARIGDRLAAVAQAGPLWWRLLGWRPPRTALGTLTPAQHAVVVLACLVPGLGHALAGRRRFGLAILGVYLGLLVASIVFLTTAWTLLTALLLGLHTYAVVSCIFLESGYVPRRVTLITGMAVFAVLMYGVYRPVTWVLEGFGRLDSLNSDVRGSLFERGDVLLIAGRWLAADRYTYGDIVSYRIQRRSGQGWFIPEGILIDRVVACPGDRVECRKRRLFVNGRLVSPYNGLLFPTRLPEKLDVVLPADTYFIYPALPRMNVPYTAAQPERETELRVDLSLVRVRDIRGRVWAIVGPWDRARRL